MTPWDYLRGLLK